MTCGSSTPSQACPAALRHRHVVAGTDQFTEQVTIDSTPAANLGAFLTLDPGAHTLSYEVRSDCAGSAVHVPVQEVALIPYTLP